MLLLSLQIAEIAPQRITHPLGTCLYSVFFLVPAVHITPSSLHLLHGFSPSHFVFFMRLKCLISLVVNGGLGVELPSLASLPYSLVTSFCRSRVRRSARSTRPLQHTIRVFRIRSFRIIRSAFSARRYRICFCRSSRRRRCCGSRTGQRWARLSWRLVVGHRC